MGSRASLVQVPVMAIVDDGIKLWMWIMIFWLGEYQGLSRALDREMNQPL